MPFGPSNLWAAIDKQVDVQVAHVDVQVGRGLHRVDVEHDAAMAADATDQVGHGLDRAHLVVGQHQRDQDRAVIDRRVELLRIHPAVAIDRQDNDFEAELLQVAQRVERRVMLDRTGNEAVALRLARPGACP